MKYRQLRYMQAIDNQVVILFHVKQLLDNEIFIIFVKQQI